MPTGDLILAKDGYFYGTTYSGGSFSTDSGAGKGTIYKLSPSGVLTTIFNFGGGKGYWPCGRLTQGQDGSFYGTTIQGGKIGDGSIFRLSPDGSVNSLYSFGAYDELSNENTNGWAPVGLVEGVDGNFYGLTGNYGFKGGGTIFKISPDGRFATLKTFLGRNTIRPISLFIQGKDGFLYSSIGGSLLKMNPKGEFTTIIPFNGGNHNLSIAGFIIGRDGKLYGVVTCGKTGGAILKMDVNGKFYIVAKINGLNGEFECPSGELIEAHDGNFYGVNMHGGKQRNGTIFRLKNDGTYTTIFTFDELNGHYPNTRLVQGKNGSIYGTAMGGANGDQGIVFRFSPEIK